MSAISDLIDKCFLSLSGPKWWPCVRQNEIHVQ